MDRVRESIGDWVRWGRGETCDCAEADVVFDRGKLIVDRVMVCWDIRHDARLILGKISEGQEKLKR